MQHGLSKIKQKCLCVYERMSKRVKAARVRRKGKRGDRVHPTNELHCIAVLFVCMHVRRSTERHNARHVNVSQCRSARLSSRTLYKNTTYMCCYYVHCCSRRQLTHYRLHCMSHLRRCKYWCNQMAVTSVRAGVHTTYINRYIHVYIYTYIYIDAQTATTAWVRCDVWREWGGKKIYVFVLRWAMNAAQLTLDTRFMI